MSDLNDTIGTMETTLDNKIDILATLIEYQDDYPDLSEFFRVANLTPYAFGVKYGHIILTGEGEKIISQSFAFLLKVLDKDDTGFESLTELFE